MDDEAAWELVRAIKALTVAILLDAQRLGASREDVQKAMRRAKALMEGKDEPIS